MTDCHIAAERHGDRDPRTCQHKVIDEGRAVGLVQQLEREAGIDETTTVGHETVGQKNDTQQKIGDRQRLQPDIDLSLCSYGRTQLFERQYYQRQRVTDDPIYI